MIHRHLYARRYVAIAYDVVVAVCAWLFCFWLGYGFALPESAQSVMLQSLPLVVGSQLACFAWFKLHRGIWRYASVHDFRQIALAVGCGTVLVTVILFFYSRAYLVPRSALILDPLILVLLMAGGRITYRWWKENLPYSSETAPSRPVLILGAGEGAFRLIQQLHRTPTWSVVGLLDDDTSKIGRNIAGLPILGRWRDVAKIAGATGAKHALLAIHKADHTVRRRAFDLCRACGVKLLVVPDIDDLISERVRVSTIRDVDVDDLLGRDPVQLDITGLNQLLAGRNVLVTGAGGSIGSELCRQIARFRPASIVLFESSEFALYRIYEELQRDFPELQAHAVIGDVKDAGRLRHTFAHYPIEMVFHAAAYKHVPMMETLNAWQAIQNNTLGTLRLMEVIADHPVERLVFVSTDKAVNPTSVMGASKRLAEILLRQWHRKSGTRIIIVRFGNVLGSTGSVVPKFKEQIARGGPITITHPEITRYFMSVSEASQLMLQAALMGQGGEIFVLDMGEPVRILDLAQDLVRLSGLAEHSIPIEFTGLRPGEKLYEELLSDDEATLSTPHPKLRVARPVDSQSGAWEALVRKWIEESVDPSDDEVRAGLARFVPEYQPFEGSGSNVIPLRDATLGRDSRLSAGS
ncbi:MAG: polysaccharide biosynthesis protein [Burkholderiaceae bacterium]